MTTRDAPDSVDINVQQVAHLARLLLSDAEQHQLQQDLRSILDYVQQLNELDTQAVRPTAHAVALPTALRADRVGTSLPVALGLANAPERLGDGFGVPKIID